ncbi:unnamed protein product [Rhodiola kirilowii]
MEEEAPAASPQLAVEDVKMETDVKEEAVGGKEKSLKRASEEGGDGDENEEKKQKVDQSAEEVKVDQSAEEVKVDQSDVKEVGNAASEVKLGPKTFGSSTEMFDYFFKLLHYWPTNLNLNKYEQMVLLDLLKKGHAEADKKIGVGIKSFQVRYHPLWKSRCFFLIREDESYDDFSFRKCVDHILPLPENMKGRPEVNKSLGGRGGGGGGYRARGRGGGRRGK